MVWLGIAEPAFSPILSIVEPAFSPIVPIVEPADGGDELCSVVPPEVSALPEGGTVADLDASGDTVFAVGGADGDEVSAASTGVTPMLNATAINAR
jgi:hypothetical protein